jgi:hypothetical protein
MLYMSTSKCFVVILSETRAAHLTFDNIKVNLLRSIRIYQKRLQFHVPTCTKETECMQQLCHEGNRRF